MKNEIVDLEIIILNPDSKTRNTSKNNNSSPEDDNSSSKTNLDMREFDPFAPEPKKTLVDDDDKLFKDLSSNNQNSIEPILSNSRDSKVSKSSKKDKRSRRSRAKSPAIDSNTLEEMERRYKEGKGESGSSIDFLDYF